MDLNFKFRNQQQRKIYYSRARNQCFSGALNNGKSLIGCFKILSLVLTFANYRALIARQTYKDLKATTMETFFKICPKEVVLSHNVQDGFTIFTNGSKIRWFHLDNADESTLKGFEPNSILVDQAEETEEKMYDMLDARLGRWDEAIIPQRFIDAQPDWPISETGKYIAPSYLILLCNPDNEFHYIYRKFHPDSIDRIPNYFYVEGEWDPGLGSIETYEAALRRDKEWVDKFVRGKWGASSSAIHYLPKECLLQPIPELLDRIRTHGNLYRILDHGDSAPTCCLWSSALDGVYIFYREYYLGGKPISYHRQSISDLSGDERYAGNYADPQIFKKTAQKDGGFWSVSDEYMTSDLDAPSLTWIPADNNEFATRNRINELLIPSPRFRHPITKVSPAPGMYFIQATSDYPYGCKEAYRQLGNQRKILLGTIEGKSIYSDERDENITDHAYDCVRYFVAQHGTQPNKARKIIPRRSFEYYNQVNSILAARRPVVGSIEEVVQ